MADRDNHVARGSEESVAADQPRDLDRQSDLGGGLGDVIGGEGANAGEVDPGIGGQNYITEETPHGAGTGAGAGNAVGGVGPGVPADTGRSTGANVGTRTQSGTQGQPAERGAGDESAFDASEAYTGQDEAEAISSGERASGRKDPAGTYTDSDNGDTRSPREEAAEQMTLDDVGGP
jgi:hypothetical protein